MGKSEFTGGLFSYVVHAIGAGFIVALTFGIATPWAVVFLKRWEIEHTIIDGKRLYFDGKAINLFGQWIKWFFLTIVTFGIYSFWVNIKMKQWVTKHTHFVV